MNCRIGWIGTGVMGSAMGSHLLAAGHSLSVYNRTADKTRSLVEKGALLKNSPAAVASSSDIVFTMVGYPTDVAETILGVDGVLSAASRDTILVDMTTSEPSLAVRIHGECFARGVKSLDAPVSGGDVGAREARLSIMVGGDKDVFDAVLPILNLMGKTIVYQGAAGSGQHTKMANQILIATGMIGVCEALLYAYKAGLDLNVMLQSVSGGAAGSWSLSNYAPRILSGNLDPGFLVDHFVKDMGIALAEAKRMKLSLPGLALAEQLYIALQAQGHGRKGTHSLMLALASISSIPWPPGP